MIVFAKSDPYNPRKFRQMMMKCKENDKRKVYLVAVEDVRKDSSGSAMWSHYDVLCMPVMGALTPIGIIDELTHILVDVHKNYDLTIITSFDDFLTKVVSYSMVDWHKYASDAMLDTLSRDEKITRIKMWYKRDPFFRTKISETDYNTLTTMDDELVDKYYTILRERLKVHHGEK